MCDDITPQRHQYYGGYGHDEMILWMCSGDEQGGAPAIQYGVVGVVALVGAGLNLLCVKNIAGPASDEVLLKKRCELNGCENCREVSFVVFSGIGDNYSS